MRVRPRPPERADARQAGGAVAGQPHRAGDGLDAAVLRYRRRRLREVQVGRDQLVLEDEDRLDQPGDARRGLGVTDVGLDGADPQRALGRPPAEDVVQRGQLDRVAQVGAGAVRLHVVDVVGGHPGGGERPADDVDLRASVRRGEPVAAAVLVDRRAAQHRPDPPAVLDRLGQRLQHHDAAALAEDVAVGARVEGLALPVRAQHRPGARLDEAGRVEGQRRAGRDREVALTAPQGLRRQVDRDQR